MESNHLQLVENKDKPRPVPPAADPNVTQVEIDEAISTINQLMQNLVDLQSDWQADFDELSERQQEGKKGEALQEHIDALQSAMDDLDGLEGKITEAFDALADHKHD